jgi:hypothetical protein
MNREDIYIVLFLKLDLLFSILSHNNSSLKSFYLALLNTTKKENEHVSILKDSMRGENGFPMNH